MTYYDKYLKYKKKYLDLKSYGGEIKNETNGPNINESKGPNINESIGRNKAEIELVVDIGSTSTKIGWRPINTDNNFEIKRFPYKDYLESANILPVFLDPDKMPRKILEFAYSHLNTPGSVKQIGWSQSGIINTEDGSIIKSFALNDLAESGKNYDGFKLSEKLQQILPDGAPKCKALNDGVAAGVGIMELAKKNRFSLPCLSLCLGTGPAITVITKNKIYLTEGKWNCKIGITGGEKELFSAIGSKAVEDISDERFSGRIKRSLKCLLQKYLNQFGWQPNSIVISGGLANRVKQNILENNLAKAENAPLNSPIPKVYVLKGVDQQQLQIKGAAFYSKNFDLIKIENVSKMQ